MDNKLNKILDKIDQNQKLSWEEYKYCFVDNGELKEELEYEIYTSNIERKIDPDEFLPMAA